MTWGTVGPRLFLCVKQLQPYGPCVGQYKEGCRCRHQYCALSVTGEENRLSVRRGNTVPLWMCLHTYSNSPLVWINGKIWIKCRLCVGSFCLFFSVVNISNMSKQWFVHLLVHLVPWWNNLTTDSESADSRNAMILIVICLSGRDG